jgi:branched-chain amino acid transport system ATP-binding protein
LAFADRFLIYALFDGDIESVSGFAIDLYCILLSALIAYRLTLAAQMVRQYPWLYERVLLFGWRARRTPYG